jgi:Cd2+/Zn2+-exporting ATPase
MNRNRREIAALLALQPETALRVGPDGAEDVVTIERLQVGDVLRVKPGERIPADGVLVQGRTYVDESAITGEAYPVGKAAGDPVFAGTVNLRGSFLMETTKPNSETLFSQIIRLVQSAQREKAPSQQFIERHEGTYVKIVLAAVAATIVLPPFIAGWSWTESVYRAMVLLVVASPCALVASVMPAALAAIAAGARRGILFKGGAHLEQLGRIRAIAFDKTGTLTKGRPEITDIVPRDGLSERELLRYAAGVEQYSDHPLAAAIVRHAAGLGAAPVRPEQTEDIAGHGVSAVIEGERWLAGKAEFVGAAEAAAFRGGIAAELSRQGKTLVFLRDERGIAGLIAFQDVVREEAADAVRALKRLGITPVMLTGDGRATAEAIARESGIEAVVAECLPETKAAEVKRLAARFGPTAMVGDGINDAPALAAADVGIAMGQGTDAALETADVVLMKNDLPRLAEAVRLSRRMNRIVRQNIAFSVAVIALLVASNFTQALDLPLGVIGHEGSTILVILNGLRLLRG